MVRDTPSHSPKKGKEMKYYYAKEVRKGDGFVITLTDPTATFRSVKSALEWFETRKTETDVSRVEIGVGLYRVWNGGIPGCWYDYTPVLSHEPDFKAPVVL